VRYLFRAAATLFWSELLPSLVGLFLIIQGLLDQKDRSERLIFVAAVAIVVHSVVRFLREQTIQRQRMLVDPKLRARLNTLLGTFNQFGPVELFKLELYLVGWQFGLFASFPWLFGRRLRRHYSVALMSSVTLRDDRQFLSSGPLALCRSSNIAQFWCPPTVFDSSLNCFSAVPVDINDELALRCGALRAVPVTDGLARSVLGVLIAHVEPSSADKLAGTLAQELVVRSLSGAAQDVALMLGR
jgi:hypothetical protein